jgi:group I intron endonuclease
VYCFRNRFNGKAYVGSTGRCFFERRRQHLQLLKTGDHKSRRFQAAWHRWGAEAFIFEILEVCPPERCIETEQWWLDTLKSWDRRFGYNTCRTAGRTDGYKHTEDARRRMAAAKRGKKQTPEAVAARVAAHRGKKRSAEVRARMSEAQRRWRQQHPEEAAAQTAALMATNLGTKRSENVRQKLSEIRKGKRHSAETRDKMSRSHKGYVKTEEHRLNLSLSQKGRKLTEEHKAALREGHRRRRERAAMDLFDLVS